MNKIIIYILVFLLMLVALIIQLIHTEYINPVTLLLWTALLLMIISNSKNMS
jgi:hypothetical protein